MLERQTRILVGFHATAPTLSYTVADPVHSDLICIRGLGIGGTCNLEP